ncbi:MAG: hypothetical protein ACK5JD_13690 [Mangrovibacterium sp.]
MKVTDKIRKQAVELAEKHGFRQIWVNEKGEFFSNQSYAAHSVGGDITKYAEIALGAAVEATATNDLGKAADVIAAIEGAADAEAVQAILKAEQEGKNRKSVIEAASKKLAALTAKQQDAGTNGDTAADKETEDGEPSKTTE